MTNESPCLLVFFLRANEAVRREYEALKREVYARHPADIDAYNDGKNAWIKRIEAIAKAWFRERALSR